MIPVKSPKRFDVCVIGAGVAGTIAAIECQKNGLSVAVIERKAFPRFQIGTSFHESAVSLLERLGIWESIQESRAFSTMTTQIEWAGKKASKSTCSVDRAAFDHSLLNYAKQVGVEIYHPAIPGRPIHAGSFSWLLKVKTGHRLNEIESRFIIDASGRSNFLRKKRNHRGCRTIAMWAKWSECGVVPSHIKIHSGLDEWFWTTPVGNEQLIAVFVDPHSLRRSNSKMQVYLDLVGTAPLVTPKMNLVEKSFNVRDATCWSSEDPIGEDWIQIGEACFTLDPMSSQGVHSAMVTGVQAAAIANTNFKQKCCELSRRFYLARTESIQFHCANISRMFYQEQAEHSPSEFWLRRARLDAPHESRLDRAPLNMKANSRLSLGSKVIFQKIPVLAGNVISERLGLVYPNGHDPIVTLDGIAIEKMLTGFDSIHVEDLKRKWTGLITLERMDPVIQLLWQKEILVAGFN